MDTSNERIYLRTSGTDLNLTEQLWNHFSNPDYKFSDKWGYMIYFRGEQKFRLKVDKSFWD